MKNTPTLSKETAMYIPAMEYTGKRHCEKCVMFRTPSGCTLVRGHIERRATCKRWAKK